MDMGKAALLPAAGHWRDFGARILMFGPEADVVNYNVAPRLMTELFTQKFGIPAICFLDYSHS